MRHRDPVPNDDGMCSGDRSAWFKLSNKPYENSALLLAMPFPSGVPEDYLGLQIAVADAINQSNSIKDRLQSLERVLFISKKLSLPDDEIQRIENRLLSTFRGVTSSRLTLLELTLSLKRNGVKLRLNHPDSGAPCAPLLVVDSASRRTSVDVTPQEGSQMWTLLSEFLRMSPLELFSVGSEECEACICVLFLYMLYVVNDYSNRSHFQSESLSLVEFKSLWRALDQSVSDEHKMRSEFYDRRYGKQALASLLHKINGFNDPSKQDVEPECIDQPCQSLPQESSVGKHRLIECDIPPSHDRDISDVIRRLENLKTPLPVCTLPSVAELKRVQDLLCSEFPWAVDAVHMLMGDLLAKRRFGSVELTFSPVLLVGPPGVGKTRLVKRFAEELKSPFFALSLAGSDDSRSILGTSRGWSTAQPAPLIDFLSRRAMASAVVLLDEIEKCTNRTSNSQPATTALLSLLEPENAQIFFDAFLQTAVDLSKVSYVATANSLAGIPDPLLSRMRICLMRHPDYDQLAQSVHAAAREVAKDWGVDARVFPEILASDLDAKPRNMRDLKMLVRQHLQTWAESRLKLLH